MSNSSAASYFHIFITGQIESVSFALGPDASELFCRYEMVAGPDWTLISGAKNGITQSAASRGSCLNDEIAFNMPIELTYKSTNPFGWPQMIICIYGKNKWGVEIVLGYSRLHIPVLGSHMDKIIKTPIIIPKCKNMLTEISNWLTNKNPELKIPKILADGSKNKDLSTESYGEFKLRLSTVSRGSSRLGYDWGQHNKV